MEKKVDGLWCEVLSLKIGTTLALFPFTGTYECKLFQQSASTT